MTKIIQRHDIAANWTTINPILASGEMGVETDTNKFKFGDGATAWNSLAYAAGEGGGGGSGTTLTSTNGATVYSKLAIGNTLSVAKGDEYTYSPYITFSNEPTNGTFTGGNGRYAKVLIPEYDFHTANSWEFQTKITWGTVRTYAAVMGLYNNKDCHNPVLIYEQDKLGMFLGSTGSNWNITTPSKSNLVPVSGTTYYIKMGFTGSQYYFKYNTTGWNYDFTTAQSVNNSNKVYTEGQVQFALLNGFLTVNNYYNDSTMYLEDTALILNETEIFRAANNVSTDTLNINLNELDNEVNTLASTKQDKLTAVSPIRIYEYTPDYTYVGYTIDSSNNLTKDSSSSHYILMPYNKNYLYKFYVGSETSGWLTDTDWIVASYGYIGNDGNFKRITNDVSYSKLTILADDGSSIFSVGNNSNNITNVSGTDPKMASNNYYAHSQLYVDGITLKYNTSLGMISKVQGTNYQTTVSEEVAVQLAKITHIQVYYNGNIIPYLNGSNKRSMGYFDIKGWCMDLDKTTRVNIMEEKATATYPNKLEFIAKGISELRVGSNPATTSSLGVVQPDGTSITVNEAGVISGQDIKTFTGYSDTGTLVLKSINGVLQWVAE